MTQGMLFQFDDNAHGIRDIASELNASEASVRNWIKAGYLTLDSNKRITGESYARFRKDIVGSQKLIKRANKQFLEKNSKVSTSHSPSSKTSCVSADYEASLSLAYRNQEGIFYTPDDVAERFFDDLPRDREALMFCDPCCGTGNFLLAAIKNGFSPENVFGFDTDMDAVGIAKKRLSKYSKFRESNVKVADYLQLNDTEELEAAKFDIIITNPPWGKKLPKERRAALGSAWGAGKSIDTCSLFLFASLKQLKNNGTFGFLLPESFFNVGAFEAVRRHALGVEVIAVTDFGKPFAGLLSKAVGIVGRNCAANDRELAVRCQTAKGLSHIRRQDSFVRNPNAIINYNTNSDEMNTIDHVMRISHSNLRGRARWGLGIVTGNNARFVKNRSYPDYIPVWKGSDIFAGKIKPPSSFIPKNVELYQQVASLDIYDAPEKLIYKFISNRLEFFRDDKQRYVLNSANIMIPDDDFNFDLEYLSQYLNSNFINWIFRSTFGTHKILRSDLEWIPLFLDFMESGGPFREQALLSYLGIKEAKNGTFRIA